MQFTSSEQKLAVYKEFNAATNYDNHTGIFTWKQCSGTQRVPNSQVGASKATGGGLFYQFYSSVGKFPVKLHHAAWLRVYGNLPVGHIDHINCVPSDNSVKNLRDIPSSKNYHNRPAQINCSSGLPGVIWVKSRHKWQVAVKHLGRAQFVGRYDTLLDAAFAVFNKRLELGYTMRPGLPKFTDTFEEGQTDDQS